MSPWGLIGWLLAGLLALAVTLGLYFLSQMLGWVPWIAPLVLWIPLMLFGLSRLLIWFISRTRPERLPALDPSNPFTGQWEAIKSGLAGQAYALYLVVGDDDESKRSLLSRSLGQAEYQASPSGPAGLCLWAAEGRAWLNVPAALWTDRKAGPDPAAALIGDWGHLLKLLPGFPGSVAGLVVLMDPAGVRAGAEQLGGRLARKLPGLTATVSGPLPWWLVLHPLENLPEGARLEEALRAWSSSGSDLWDRPFGLELPDRGDGKTADLSVRLGRSLAALGNSLEDYLHRADCSPQPPPLSREVLSLGDQLLQLPLGLLAAGLDEGRRESRLECRGLYLALDSAQGPGQFSRMLFQHLIPGQPIVGRGPGSPFFRRTLMIGASVLAVVLLALMAYGQWRGGRAIALAGELRPLLAQVEGRIITPPPVADLALSSDLVLKMDDLARGPARFYSAPGRAARLGREQLAGQLRRYLAPGQPKALTLALGEWSGRDLRALTFPVPQASSSVLLPAFTSGEGRRRAAELSGKWADILGENLDEDQGSPARSTLVRPALADYDLEVLQNWRRAAEELDSALIVTPQNLRAAAGTGLGECTVGLDFLEAVGREITLPWAEAPPWVRLAREFNLIKSWTGAGDLINDGQDFQSILKRLRRPDLPLGPGGVDQLMRAGQAWREYEAGLNGLSPLARTPKGLSALAEEMFGGSPPPPERSSLIALHMYGREALNQIENLAQARPDEERELVARLFLSPVDWLMQGSVAAAAQSLEEEWNRKVILPARDLSGLARVELLLGEDGAVAAFREGPARPFLVADPRGFQAAEALGRPFPWNRDFLKFINSGQEVWRKSAGGLRDVKIAALLRPVRAEGPAVVHHPLGVRLEMICEVGQFRAETFNSPATFKAEWTPQDCGPLSLTVIFRDFKLVKQYSGAAGLNDFVKSAAQGEVRLSAADFPDRVHLLKAAGTEVIILGLDLDRGPELIKILNTPLPKLNPPGRIIEADQAQ